MKGKELFYLLVHLDVQPIRHFVVLEEEKYWDQSHKRWPWLLTSKKNVLMYLCWRSPWHNVSASRFSRWPVSHTPVSGWHRCHVGRWQKTLLRITDVNGEKRKSPRIKATGMACTTSCYCKNAFQKRESLAPASPADTYSAGTRR